MGFTGFIRKIQQNAKSGDDQQKSPHFEKYPMELKISGYDNFGIGITDPWSDLFISLFLYVWFNSQYK